MCRLTKTAAGVVAAMLVLGGAPAGADGTPKLTIDVTGLFMHREVPDSRPLLSTTLAAGTGALLNASQIDPGWQPGVAGRIHAAIHGRWGAEVGGMYLTPFEDRANPESADGFFVFDAAFPFFFAAPGTMNVHWESKLAGLEASGTVDLAPGIQAFGGVRYIQLDEALTYLITTDVSDVNFSFVSRNTLIGPQIGARFDLGILTGQAIAPFSFGAEVRAGYLYNQADVSGAISFLPTALGGDDVWSPVLQAGVSAGVDIARGVRLGLGYQVLWIGKIAQATDQQAGYALGSAVLPVETDDLLFHGAMATLTIRLN